MSDTAGGSFVCSECGMPSFTDKSDVNHHESTAHPHGIDYDTDRNYVPVDDKERAVLARLYRAIYAHLSHDLEVQRHKDALPALFCFSCDCIILAADDQLSLTKAWRHAGHDIEAVAYAGGANVAIECLRCGEALLDADDPDGGGDGEGGDPRDDARPPTVGLPRLATISFAATATERVAP